MTEPRFIGFGAMSEPGFIGLLGLMGNIEEQLLCASLCFFISVLSWINEKIYKTPSSFFNYFLYPTYSQKQTKGMRIVLLVACKR